MDLQLFAAEERTEEASPKRLREAREKGQFPRSVDLVAGLGLVAAAMIIKSSGPALYEIVARAMGESLGALHRVELTPEVTAQYFQEWVLLFARAVLPIVGTLVAVGVGAGLLQSRFHLSLSHLAPDFSHLNPMTGLSRIFSLRTLVELLKGLFKLGVVGAIAYSDAKAMLPQVPNLMGQSVSTGVIFIAGNAVSTMQKVGFGLMALGILDYGYQYWEFLKSVRMTKQEVKQENKEQEGNPELKQKQRQKARELARRRKAIKDVPTADVVITNPTHYAIAIKFETGDSAPRVLAKGSDLLAQRMKVIAKQHDVPMVENRSLARSLYAMVDVGKTVPPELYQAVAEVLAFVYSLRRQERHERILQSSGK